MVIGTKEEYQSFIHPEWAHVYVRDNSGKWTHQAEFAGEPTRANCVGGCKDSFGASVDIYEDTIIISAPHEFVTRIPWIGTVSVFVRSGVT